MNYLALLVIVCSAFGAEIVHPILPFRFPTSFDESSSYTAIFNNGNMNLLYQKDGIQYTFDIKSNTSPEAYANIIESYSKDPNLTILYHSKGDQSIILKAKAMSSYEYKHVFIFEKYAVYVGITKAISFGELKDYEIEKAVSFLEECLNGG